MKRFIILIASLVLICILASCGRSTSSSTTEPSQQPTTQEPSTTIGDNNTTTQQSEDDELMNKTLSLKIGDTLVDVYWLDNASVTALKKLAKDGLTIEMHMYSTFEQVGSLGTTITSSDTRITTTPGDICLYSSNQIVLFYGANTWEYTKLGHINLSKNELNDLLGDEDVVITITLK